ncbi:PIG-L family deacetylase [Deinococcus psychrotolerans]|uniref:PIG-L family deacetylase n=1 Tax=Deinococcus psychrotolerans TaxID=2489213 RepID=A0A3G8Y9Z0_9DEIO|nr:PIG-L deacetylase family protein [Deinococcus psychrotolerans]AZI42178.1 PIG-L family deacetylase [Deinococcus psychrotolerans]
MTTQQPTILAVFAHPDDEAFSVGGTLAHYAQRGVNVVLACATRGEAGKISDPNMTITDLGQHREDELKRATAELGIPDPVFLDYHDSGRYERTRYDDPLALMNVNPFTAELKIRDLIASVKPDILITFDPHGGYGHIDHLIIHRAAAAAFFSSGNLGGGGLMRLYFSALSVEAAQGLARMGQDLDPNIYGVADNTIAVKMDVSAQAGRKKAALIAHGSQTGPNSRMGQMSQEERDEMEKRMLSTEGFSIGGTRTGLPAFPMRGLFDGLVGFEALDD